MQLDVFEYDNEKIIFTDGYLLEAYIPDNYFKIGSAEQVTDGYILLGNFTIKYKKTETSDYLVGQFELPIKFHTMPDEVVKIKTNIGRGEDLYHVFRYYAQSVVISSSEIVRSPDNVEKLTITAFEGKLDNMSYDRIPVMYNYGKMLNGVSLRVPSFYEEVVFSTTYRSVDNINVEARYVAKSEGTKVIGLSNREKAPFVGTYEALTFEDKNTLLTVVHNRQMDGIVDTPSDVEKYTLGGAWINNESVLLSKPNTSYRLDDWLNGNDNILFIFGYAGSGKSTTGKLMAEEFDAEFIEIDALLGQLRKKYGEDEVKFSKNPEKASRIIMEYVEEKALHGKVIVEGTQLIKMDFEKVKIHPIIIINTSLAVSSIRAIKRAYKPENRENYSGASKLYVPKHNIKNYIKFEEFKKNIEVYNNLNESHIVESINIKDVDKSLVSYIETKIMPQYNNFDSGHNVEHARGVIEYSFIISKDMDVNSNMIYTIAAYHDIGLGYGSREDHHINSKKYVLNDKNLKKWFSDEEINTIAQSCLEHRASSDSGYSSIYSQIVTDADKLPSLDAENMFLRSYRYNKDKYPFLTNDQIFENVYSHLKEKFGSEGYAKIILPESQKIANKTLKDTRKVLSDRNKARVIFDKVILL